MSPSSVVNSVTTFADGFGRWQAHIGFSRTLSESDPRAEFNLNAQWKSIRARARTAIVAEIIAREQKTGETRSNAEHRVRMSLPKLVVIDQDIDSMNCWHGITLGES